MAASDDYDATAKPDREDRREDRRDERERGREGEEAHRYLFSSSWRTFNSYSG